MQNTVPAGEGAMAAILGLDGETVEKVTEEIPGASVANYNCPGQIVITGEAEAVAEAGNALKEAGVPAWMHLYSKGGHGYGLRDTGAAVNEWPDRAEDWFREIGVIE